MKNQKKMSSIRYKRTIGYFIDATNEIIDEEGINAVTIRNVSERAGYTSAAMYSYFDSLNHLVFLATMTHLETYIEDVIKRTNKCSNSIETCIEIFDCFCDHSFKEPEVYTILFFKDESDKLEDYTKQYFTLFPDKAKYDFPLISEMSHVNNIYYRSTIMMNECVKDNYISSQNADILNSISIMMYRSFLQDVLNEKKNIANAKREFMKYYKELFSRFVYDEYKTLIL